MYKLCSNLLVYENLGEDSIIFNLARIIKDFDSISEESGSIEPSKSGLIDRIYHEVRRLLDIATEYGFNGNLWQNYLTWLLITRENSFSVTSELSPPQEGSINSLVKKDCMVFMELFHYDFAPIEESLGIDCFSTIIDYHAIEKHERMYNRRVSSAVRELSEKLASCISQDSFFDTLRSFYAENGSGIFAVNRAFRCLGQSEGHTDGVVLYPVANTDDTRLCDLIGYESQKERLIQNTRAFVNGLPANNCLLYGDSGTGKSTAIKALCNEFYDKGLRLIELYKHQCKDLSSVISQVKSRNYYFIIYMDDLSFEEFETEYKYLKAVIEGGVERRPDNVLIYATSNRRHLIRENWSDRSDVSISGGLHHSDTMQEKLSLFNRFGIAIQFLRPAKKDFEEIVISLAHRMIPGRYSDAQLLEGANRWEISHGGPSGRCATQYIDYLAGL